jgi:hypothetical protein
MDCYHHPGIGAAATCVACRQPICAECQEEIAGHPMCHACVAAAAARLAQPETRAEAEGVEQGAPIAPLPAALAPPTPISAAAVPLAPASPTPALPFDGVPPGLVRRVLRGMGWGVLYGQWWTLWTLLSMFIWGHGSFSARIVIYLIVMAVVFGFFGSVTGVIIGALNASENTGTGIGIGMGILLCVLEVLLARSAGGLVNLFFYFFTGRYVGRGITGRVQQPLPSPGRVSDVAAV